MIIAVPGNPLTPSAGPRILRKTLRFCGVASSTRSASSDVEKRRGEKRVFKLQAAVKCTESGGLRARGCKPH